MSNYFSNLDESRFVSLTTYRKSGEAISSPLLYFKAGQKLVIYTNLDSGKVKRIRNNGKVQVAPCKVNGEVTGNYIDARARIITDPEEDKQGLAAIMGKHPFVINAFEIINRLRGKKMVRIAVEPVP